MKILSVQEKKVLDNPNSFGGDIYVFDKEAEAKVLEMIKDYKESDQQIILSSLSFLFSKRGYEYYEKNQNCIAKIGYTNIYLRNNIVEGEVKISEFRKALNDNELLKLSSSFTKYKNLVFSSLTKELINFIQISKLTRKEQVIDVLKTINNIAGTSNYFLPYDSALAFLNKIYKEIYESKKSEFQNDLSTVILENDKLSFFDNLLSEYNIKLERERFKTRTNPHFDNLEVKFDFMDDDFVKKTLLKKLEVQITNEASIDTIVNTYNFFTERLVLDNRIMRSKESNELLRNDIEKRKEAYFKSKLFSFNRSSDDLEMIGFVPYIYLSAIFSNSITVDDFLEEDTNQTKYHKIYNEGWDNVNTFIQSLSHEELNINKEELSFVKVLMKAFVDGGYKSLAKEKYYEIKSNVS